VEYLVTRGVARNRLSPHGYGESELRNNCTDGVGCTEQEHARNRRTEVRVISGVNGGASMMYVDGQVGGVESYEDPVRNVNNPTGNGVYPEVESNTFYVIAGTFRLETGAQTRLAEVQQLGYDDAKIVRFPNLEYYYVCAAQFDTKKAANAVKRKLLREDKMEAIVKVVQ